MQRSLLPAPLEDLMAHLAEVPVFGDKVVTGHRHRRVWALGDRQLLSGQTCVRAPWGGP